MKIQVESNIASSCNPTSPLLWYTKGTYTNTAFYSERNGSCGDHPYKVATMSHWLLWWSPMDTRLPLCLIGYCGDHPYKVATMSHWLLWWSPIQGCHYVSSTHSQSYTHTKYYCEIALYQSSCEWVGTDKVTHDAITLSLKMIGRLKATTCGSSRRANMALIHK